MLVINVACYVAGIAAYASRTDSVETNGILFWSAVAILLSFGGSLFVTHSTRNSSFSNEESTEIDENSAEVGILQFIPATLVAFEVASIYGLGVSPHSVGWINIAIACYIGQSLEYAFRR